MVCTTTQHALHHFDAVHATWCWKILENRCYLRKLIKINWKQQKCSIAILANSNTLVFHKWLKGQRTGNCLLYEYFFYQAYILSRIPPNTNYSCAAVGGNGFLSCSPWLTPTIFFVLSLSLTGWIYIFQALVVSIDLTLISN